MTWLKSTTLSGCASAQDAGSGPEMHELGGSPPEESDFSFGRSKGSWQGERQRPGIPQMQRTFSVARLTQAVAWRGEILAFVDALSHSALLVFVTPSQDPTPLPWNQKGQMGMLGIL